VRDVVGDCTKIKPNTEEGHTVKTLNQENHEEEKELHYNSQVIKITRI